MKDVKYKIADHVVRITYLHGNEDENLLPSFGPFVYDGDEQEVTHITIDQEWEWTKAEEVGQFDVGGNNHGVYRTVEGGYQFEISDHTGSLCSRMQSSADFSECTVRIYGETWNMRNFGLNNSIMIAYAFSTVLMKTILIHASVIRCEGRGYLMTAPSGTGKSTHTHLWYTTIPGCDLMNDDNPIIRIFPERNEAIVYGSPWSGKTPCYRNIQAPVGGIIRIQQRPENSIRRLSVFEAFAMLLPSCSSMKWDQRVYDGICESVSALIKTSRIWELGCLPNAEAAILCHDNVAKFD